VKFKYKASAVNLLNEHYLWASMVWGAIATGYLIYGWRQRVLIPFIGGLAMTAASILVVSALWMSLICLAVMAVVYWLLKHGY
jgi:hypothetical protein